MKRFLVVVDMQKDFVDGSLGTKEAMAIVPAVTEKVQSFEGDIFVTYDTHFEDYLETAEGKNLPVTHCIYETRGWQLTEALEAGRVDGGNPALQGSEIHLRLDYPAAPDDGSGRWGGLFR